MYIYYIYIMYVYIHYVYILGLYIIESRALHRVTMQWHIKE